MIQEEEDIVAEFCLGCFNRLHHMQLRPEDVTLSEYLDLCEGCDLKLRAVNFWEKETNHILL